MTDPLLNDWSEADGNAIREQLDRILKSGPFSQSQRRQRFLDYLVNESLAGRGDRLKGYAIALEVFERPETFDPLVDPVVRIEAGRLREKLREYYDTDGRDDPVLIELPKGHYTPLITFRNAAGIDPSPAVNPGDQQAENNAEPVVAAYTEPDGEFLQPIAPRYALPNFNQMQLAMWAAAALLIVAVSMSWMKGRNAGPSLPEKPSIAVLSFDNIGDDLKWERLADGITEDIITDLSHSKDLIVIARNSTEVYKGKPVDVRQIGRDLNVKYVLEGSIQSTGDQIRVTAQLIESASGSHVWSERYERPAVDLFAVQNEVTQRIAATLSGWEGAVADAERQLIRRKPPANLTAFDTYLLAMEAKHKVTKEGLTQAESLFNKALELDPHLARAYVGLVDTQFYLIDLGLAPSVDEAISKMMMAGEKAVALDPDDGKTHYALGLASMYQGKPEQALTRFAKAESLAPSDPDTLLCIAWSIPAFGQTERAVSLAERSLKLNPHYPDWYNQGLSYVFFFGEQFDRSVKHRLLVKAPLALDFAFLAMAYSYMNRPSEARAAAGNAIRLDPTWIAERYLSDGGGSAEKEAELLVNGARKAGLTDCVPFDKVKDIPNFVRVKSCDQQRALKPE